MGLIDGVYGKIGLESEVKTILLRLLFKIYNDGNLTAKCYLNELLKNNALPDDFNEMLFVDTDHEILTYVEALFKKYELVWPSNFYELDYIENVALGSYLNKRISAEELIRFCYSEVWRKSNSDPKYLIWCQLDDDLDCIQKCDSSFLLLLAGLDLEQELFNVLFNAGKLK